MAHQKAAGMLETTGTPQRSSIDRVMSSVRSPPQTIRTASAPAAAS